MDNETRDRSECGDHHGMLCLLDNQNVLVLSTWSKKETVTMSKYMCALVALRARARERSRVLFCVCF